MKLRQYITEAKSEDIIYKDFIEYMLNGSNIKVKLSVRKRLNKKHFGYIDLSKSNIITVEDAHLKLALKRIAHELVHIIQVHKKQLLHKDGNIIFKGNSIISIKDYENASHETHKNLPFEKEAIQSYKIVDKYIKNRIQLLKGQSTELDFMIEYI